MRQYFAVYNQQFDRDQGLDFGRFSLNWADGSKGGTFLIVTATMSTAGKQDPDNFNRTGGMMPPQYRLPAWKGGTGTWELSTERTTRQLLGGLCYQIFPVYVTTETGQQRGEYFVHRNLNGVGSLGCTVMTQDRLLQVAEELDKLADSGIKRIPYFAFYS